MALKGGPERESRDAPELQLARSRAHHVVSQALARVDGLTERPYNGAAEHTIFNARTRENRRKEKRRKERQEFLRQGGTIREIDLSKEPEIAKAVAELYLQPSAIEHFMNVTPHATQEELDSYFESHPIPNEDDKKDITPTNPREIKSYYKKNPDAKLLVAEINGEVVGVATIVRTPGGLSEAKINRVVVKADQARKGLGYLLVREGIVKSFADPEQGGFGVSSIVIGYIRDIEGAEAPAKLFEEFDFGNTKMYPDRCLGWDNKENQLVWRDVQQMALDKDEALVRWRVDIKAGTSIPSKEAA